LEAELVQSSGGIFDIEYTGKLIFSKKEVGRFPDVGEVVKIIKSS
jgi:selenoprotein W-related protein